MNATFYPDELESLAEWHMADAVLLRRVTLAPSMYDAGDTVLYMSHNDEIIEWADEFRTIDSDEAIGRDLVFGPPVPMVAHADLSTLKVSKSQHRQGATMRYTVNYADDSEERISKARWDNLDLPITEYIP